MSLGHCPTHGLYHDPSQGCPSCYGRALGYLPMSVTLHPNSDRSNPLVRWIQPVRRDPVRERSEMLRRLNGTGWRGGDEQARVGRTGRD